ncbi:MAG TPA: hypothetical protein VG734_08345 [Lacunisphaera sp.]|nr:hypothetical protein [Lacunisphaera sp.]
MKTKLLVLILSSLLGVASGVANTVTVMVGSDTYVLTTLEGTFADNEAVLTSQAWWNNEALANSLSAAVGGSLGYPHVGSGNLAPFLAIDNTRFSNPFDIYTTVWRESDDSQLNLVVFSNQSLFFGSINPSPITWMVETTVPESGGMLNYVALALGLVALSRRSLRSAR